MAEAMLNTLGKGKFEAWSAGSHPVGHVSPKTIETLNRYGINTERLASKSWNNYSTHPFDLIISVCNELQGEVWPLFTGNPEKLSWDIPNPLKSFDLKEDDAFEETFLKLEQKIKALISA